MGRRDTNGVEAHERRIRFVDMLRVRAFAVLWGTETQSIVGDQLARVALSVLVFERTSSATATALTYAATYLPAIVGGALLGGLGDRFPRRVVMVVCDLLRAVLFAAMAIAGAPLPLIIGLLIVAVFIEPVFIASEVSYLSGVLTSEQFRIATGARVIAGQTAQVGGFAVGGVLVAVLGARGALLLDAGTFLLTAVIVGTALRAQPSGASHDEGVPAKESVDGPEFAGLWRDRRLRGLILLATLAGFFVVPEALAVPFGHDVGASTAETGLLLASIPLGGALGASALMRYVGPRRRLTVARAMVIGCGVPLIATAFVPHWPVIFACWLASGALAAYLVEIMSVIVQSIPDAMAARQLGILNALLLGAQGLGFVIFGIVAHQLSVGRTVALAGLVGTLLAIIVVVTLLRRGPRHLPSHRVPRSGRRIPKRPAVRAADAAHDRAPDVHSS
jgi:MFS family permease